MKKIYFLPALVSIILLFLLQMSCSTSRYIENSDAEVLSSVEQTSEGVSDEVEDASKRDLYLGGRHIEAGIECNNCHTGESEETHVSTTICVGCHKNVAAPSAEATWNVIDPHNAHIVYHSCGECHHAHRPSQNKCETCHYFDMEIP